LNHWNKPGKQAVIHKEEKIMNIKKAFKVLGFLLAFVIVLPAARADERNQSIKITFSQPVQIPGRVLPAGTYWFVLPDDITQRHQVRIFDAGRTMLYVTLFTIDSDRPQPTDKTAVTLAQRGSAQPQAIVSWFYPGNTIGHEFLYPKQMRKELAKDKQNTIVSGD
jgi:hypothetical protein